MSNKTNPDLKPDKKRRQLDSVLMQLTSQRPSVVWRGTEQIRQWIKEDINDREVYGVLLDAVQQNPDPKLREDARSILLEMMQLQSEVAKEALARFPTFISDTMTEADDAYYAGDYAKAIQLYQQILRLDQDNQDAKKHLAKAILKQDSNEQPSDIPRSAKQYYWKARSYLAAKQTLTAINLLNAAIEAAQAKGVPFPEAEEYLISAQKANLADDHIRKAENAISKGKRKEALAEYKVARDLDPSNRDIQNQIRQQTLILSLNWLVPISVLIVGGLIYYISQPPPLIPATATASTTFPIASEVIPTNMPTTSVTETSPSPVSTPAETATLAPSSSNTNTPSQTSTVTASPPPTESILGRGVINKAFVSTWKEPNNDQIGSLGLNQPVIVLELKFVSGSNWYRCRWDDNGKVVEGWILAQYITLSP